MTTSCDNKYIDLENAISALTVKYEDLLTLYNKLKTLPNRVTVLEGKDYNFSSVAKALNIAYTTEKNANILNVKMALDVLFQVEGKLTIIKGSCIKEIGSDPKGEFQWSCNKNIKSLKIYKDGVEISGALTATDRTYDFEDNTSTKHVTTYKLVVVDEDDVELEAEMTVTVDFFVFWTKGDSNFPSEISNNNNCVYVGNSKELSINLGTGEYFYIGIPNLWEYEFTTNLGKYIFNEEPILLEHNSVNYNIYKSNRCGTGNTKLTLNIINK